MQKRKLTKQIRKEIGNSHIFKANYILSILQLIFLLLFFTNFFAIIFFPNDKYGFTVNIDEWFQTNWITGQTSSMSQLLEANGWIITYQSLVIGALWSVILFFLIEFFVLKNFFLITTCFHEKSLKSEKNLTCQICSNKEKLGENSVNQLLVASIFCFLSIVYWARNYKILKVENQLKIYLFSPTQPFTINNRDFFAAIINWKKINYNTIVTLFLYLLFLSTISGLIMMWVVYGLQFTIFEKNLLEFEGDEGELYDSFVSLSPLASTLSYFTQFTNIACFFYAFTSILRPQANFFRNNTVTICLASYILVVASVYWLFLYSNEFPNGVEENTYTKIEFASTFILHGTTPFWFVIYAFLIIAYNGAKTKKFWALWRDFVVYPFTYATFLYSVPFFTKISVYGPITNLNPYNSNLNINFVDLENTFPEQGEPLFILFSLVLIIIFLLNLLVYIVYNNFIFRFKNRKRIKQINLKNKFKKNNKQATEKILGVS